MNYIEHHGIKGQKWGVRRYQNEDGSYKQGAKGRYDDSGSDSPRKKKNFGNSKLVKKYAGKHGVAGIIVKTELSTAAILTGSKIASNVLKERGNDYLASLVNTVGAAGASAISAIGLTAAIQRGRGKI